jgi:ABC-2 type transport system permease protein
MNAALFGFRSIAYKEFIHIRRDPTALIFALLIPLVQLVLFGFAIDFDVRHIRTGVVDNDRSRESREYIARLQHTQYLDIVSYLPTPEAAEMAIRRNDIRAAVIIPPDFARRTGTTRPPAVRILLDGSDGQVANPALNAFRNAPTGTEMVTVEPRVNVLYNPQIRTQVYTIPGLVAVIMQLVTVSLTSFSLVREREQGTLEQLMVSPVGRVGLILGKLCPYAALAIGEFIVVLTLGHYIFNINIAGNMVLLFFLALPFVVASLAMGLLISTVAQSQGQALQMTLLTVMPSILLSGYIAPRETLPGILWLLSYILPTTHFIQIMRGVVVRAAGFNDLLPSVIALVIIAAILLTVSTLRFRKSIA